MDTKIVQLKSWQLNEQAKEAADIIKTGGLVVFPTETVYGIGANALDQFAASNIYKVKGRPSDNPLIVHVADPLDFKNYVSSYPENSLKLVKAFWPGPLTLIFLKNELIPDGITGGLDTVAVRCPNNVLAREIIKQSGVPICAPSANISGRPSSTLFQHVFEDLNGKVDMIIDGGKSLVGIESTVLDMTSEIPTILRPGAITKEMIEQELGINLKHNDLRIKEEDVPKSPGMKYRHYSPNGIITVVYGEKNKAIEYINAETKKYENSAVICVKEYAETITCKNKEIIGSITNPKEIATNLFIALRKMDEQGIKHIYTHNFPLDDIGVAVMNRLLKAAGDNKVYV